jgi:hypothetical protein
MIIGIMFYALPSTAVLAQPPQVSSPQVSVSLASEQGRSKKLNVDRFVAELDTDKDGCVKHAEWVSAGLHEFNFQALSAQAEKNGCVTKRELLKGDPPGGIDINGDGNLTVAEMLEYQKKISGAPAPAAVPPGGVSPGNSAPGAQGQKQ